MAIERVRRCLDSDFDADHYMSIRWLLATGLIGGVALVLISDLWWTGAQRMIGLGFAVMIFIAAATAWVLDDWHTRAGRWFSLVALVVLIDLAIVWSRTDSLLALLSLPVLGGGAFLGTRAALGTALTQTAAFIWLQSALPSLAANYTLTAPASIWFALIAIGSTRAALQRESSWAWDSYHKARQQLEEARQRNVEKEQIVDELLHANRQLDLLNERVAAMRLIAEEAQRAKASFLAKVSHEFRTPLNMIIGLVDLLMQKPEPYGHHLAPELRQDLEIVQRNCQHLASMINDVLDLSQAEAGHLTLHRDWVDLKARITEALAVVQPLIDKKRLLLTLCLPDQLPLIYCDSTRIRQVLLNLLSNAARYTECGEITVQAEVQERAVVISIADTGPGISAEDTLRIFEPFYQVAGSANRAQEGSGLGLSISRQLIELHNGQLWVESKLGVGSTFSFKLPIAPSITPASTPTRWLVEDWSWRARESRQSLPRPSRRPRIVLCDEGAELTSWLNRAAVDVEMLSTENLESAIAALRTCPAHALVINAPTMDQLWKTVDTARQEVPDTPIVGWHLSSPIERALQLGAQDYLIKPITRADLREVLQMVEGNVRRVLVVDDDYEFQNLIQRMLVSLDTSLEVMCAIDGQQALTQMRASAPDLVLLDVMMPHLDGWQVMEAKQRDETLNRIPLIVVSAQDPADHPLTSGVVLATMGEGIVREKALQCTLELSRLLLMPTPEPDPGSPGTAPA